MDIHGAALLAWIQHVLSAAPFFAQTSQVSRAGTPSAGMIRPSGPINVPCGFDLEGLPIGLQLITGVLEEPRLLQVAHHYELAAQVMQARPVAPLVP